MSATVSAKTHASNPARSKGKGKGKQVKRFLDNQGAMDLVSEIVGRQEAKTSTKADRIHQRTQARAPPISKKPSASMQRLKEKKVALFKESAKLKKKKAQLKKRAVGDTQLRSALAPPRGGKKNDTGTTASSSSKPSRKRVSFA